MKVAKKDFIFHSIIIEVGLEKGDIYINLIMHSLQELLITIYGVKKTLNHHSYDIVTSRSNFQVFYSVFQLNLPMVVQF
jgi:hypothetical protein